MQRRTSDYIRNRTSVILTQETRGIVHQGFSLALGLFYTANAVRFFFFCDSVWFDSEQELVAIWKDCKSNPWHEAWAGVAATLHLTLGLVRLVMAMTTSTADLYHTMLVITLINACFFLIVVRIGVQTFPLVYVLLAGATLAYEGLVLLQAQRAYEVRHQRKYR